MTLTTLHIALRTSAKLKPKNAFLVLMASTLASRKLIDSIYTTMTGNTYIPEFGLVRRIFCVPRVVLPSGVLSGFLGVLIGWVADMYSSSIISHLFLLFVRVVLVLPILDLYVERSVHFLLLQDVSFILDGFRASTIPQIKPRGAAARAGPHVLLLSAMAKHGVHSAIAPPSQWRRRQKAALRLLARQRDREAAMATLLWFLPLLKTLTFLQKSAIGPETSVGYDWHVMEFLRWLQRAVRAPTTTLLELDRHLTAFFEQMYEEDANPAYGEKLLAGLNHRLPHVQGPLACIFPSASRSLRGWRKLMPARSKPPLPFDAMILVALSASCHHHVAMGIALMLAFSAYLRPRELTSLQPWQLIAPLSDTEEPGSSIFKNWSILLHGFDALVASKTGHFDENVVLDSSWMTPWLHPFLAALAAGRRGKAALWSFPHERLNAVFKLELRRLGLDALNCSMYSLRHGGASMDTLFNLRDVASVKLRGRWSSDRSLLRYRKASLAQREALKIPFGHRVVAAKIAKKPHVYFDDLNLARLLLLPLRRPELK